MFPEPSFSHKMQRAKYWVNVWTFIEEETAVTAISEQAFLNSVVPVLLSDPLMMFRSV